MQPQPYNLMLPVDLIALCIWREAANQNMSAKYGVACVLRNRFDQAPKYGEGWCGVITKKWQFSSFNENDPNSKKWPQEQDPAWLKTPDGRAWVESYGCALNILDDNSIDITEGAVLYFSPPLIAPPDEWGLVQHTANLDSLHFFRTATASKP